MKAAAPQAPVSGPEKTLKNRKTAGPGHSMALVRGPGKGSALFQQLMSARAAQKNDTAGKNAASRLISETEGLKGSTAAVRLPKISQQPAAIGRIRLELPAGGIAATVAAEQEKQDIIRKPARAKTPVVHALAGQLPVQLESSPKALGPAKEQKRAVPEPSKAAVVDARTAASRAEPLIRILDLRRTDKPRASFETADSRRGEAPAPSSRDPAAGIALKPGAARENFVETLPRPVPAAAAGGADAAGKAARDGGLRARPREQPRPEGRRRRDQAGAETGVPRKCSHPHECCR